MIGWVWLCRVVLCYVVSCCSPFSLILQGILAPFTDLHYNHGIEIPDSQLKYAKFEFLFYTL